MPILRVLLLVIFAVVLPVRGAVAASIPCAGLALPATQETADPHAHHAPSPEPQADPAAHAHADHVTDDPSAAADQDEAGCDRCGAACSPPALAASPSPVAAPSWTPLRYPAWTAPDPRSAGDGHERPPRTT